MSSMRTKGADLPSFLQDVLKIRDKNTFQKINNQAMVLQFDKKETIIRPDNPESQFHFLIRGKARAYVIDENGHDLTFRFAYNPGDILLDENSSITEGSFYWESIGRTWVLQVDKDLMIEVMRSNPDLRSYLESYFIECYSEQTALLYSLMTMQAKERYQWFLSYYEDFPSEIPQKYIASYLNMLPQTLSDVRTKLQTAKQ